MNDSPIMIMMVNMSIVFSVLVLLWGIITVTGKVATMISDEE